jgi:Tfp pilus assembly protein PilV
MIEVMVSLMLITVGILSLLTLLPSGWRLSGTSDMLGRAAGILQAELERKEIMIMNGNNSIPTDTIKPVYASGRATAQPGDIQYTVETKIDKWGGSYKVWVKVTWPGNTNGIAESLIVGRQMSFAQ